MSRKKLRIKGQEKEEDKKKDDVVEDNTNEDGGWREVTEDLSEFLEDFKDSLEEKETEEEEQDTEEEEEPKKKAGRESLIQKLYDNRPLRAKVDNALDEGRSYSYIINLCEKYDLELSKASITRYKQKRQESLETGMDLGDLIDGRKPSNKVVSIADREADSSKVSDMLSHYDGSVDKFEKTVSDIEVLEAIIDKGFRTIQTVDYVDAPLLLKAIELRAKLTGNKLQGLTLNAMKEIQLKQVAKESAMIEAMMEHVPEELHEVILDAMKSKEEEFYRNMDLTDEGKRLMKAVENTDIRL